MKRIIWLFSVLLLIGMARADFDMVREYSERAPPCPRAWARWK